MIHPISYTIFSHAPGISGSPPLGHSSAMRGRRLPSPSMFETVILGAGPAGTGPLVWAARAGLLNDWLQRGVALVDRRAAMGGTIGKYALNADTQAGTFLECLQGGAADSPLAELRPCDEAHDLSACTAETPPLPMVGRFLNRLGVTLAAELAGAPRSRFFGGMEATSVQCCRDGSVLADLAGAGGQRLSVRAASAVLALGGRQTSWRNAELQPGIRLDRWQRKILPSDRLMAHGGAELANRMLSRGRRPLAVIVGGSHSAFSAAWTLLEQMPALRFSPDGVLLLYRSSPRVFYPSREEALADGYRFTDADVCQATGRVHRLGGLRGDGRQVWRRSQHRDGTPRDPRFLPRALADVAPDELGRLLDAADLIIPSFGYRLRTVPVRAADGTLIRLARGGPSVDGQARLLTEHGTPLPNIFGVGLGSGFRPWGAMGGEASFHGQQNSLWLYQNGLGALIHDGVSRAAEQFRAPAESASEPEPLLQVAG